MILNWMHRKLIKLNVVLITSQLIILTLQWAGSIPNGLSWD